MYWITNWKATKNSAVIPAEGDFLIKFDPHLPKTLSYRPQKKTKPQLSEKPCNKIRHLAAVGSCA